jgi:hypothetical protein
MMEPRLQDDLPGKRRLHPSLERSTNLKIQSLEEIWNLGTWPKITTFKWIAMKGKILSQVAI